MSSRRPDRQRLTRLTGRPSPRRSELTITRGGGDSATLQARQRHTTTRPSAELRPAPTPKLRLSAKLARAASDASALTKKPKDRLRVEGTHRSVARTCILALATLASTATSTRQAVLTPGRSAVTCWTTSSLNCSRMVHDIRRSPEEQAADACRPKFRRNAFLHVIVRARC